MKPLAHHIGVPIVDARLLQNKRGKGGPPTVMYKQGDWIVERRPNGTVETDQKAAHTLADGSADLDWFLNTFFPHCTQCSATYLPGEFHPRVHRAGWPDLAIPHPTFDEERKAHRSFLVAYSALLGPVDRILLRVIEPSTANLLAFGHEIRHALIIAATEVEASWRGLLVANRYAAPTAGRFSTNDYVKLLPHLRLDQWKVRLHFHPQIEVAPFQGWAASMPTQSLPWYDAYNAVKHDREAALPRATVRDMLHAMAAINVLGFAQFGPGAFARATVPDLVRFELVSEPTWPAEQLYFQDDQPSEKPMVL